MEGAASAKALGRVSLARPRQENRGHMPGGVPFQVGWGPGKVSRRWTVAPTGLPVICLLSAVGAGAFCQVEGGLRGEVGPPRRLQWGRGVACRAGASPGPQQDRWGHASSLAYFPGICDRI